MSKKDILTPSAILNDLYEGNVDKVIGSMDAQIQSYQAAEKKVKNARLLNILGTAISGVLVIGLCIKLYFANKENAIDLVFIISVVMIAFIIICCAFLSRLTNIISAFTISFILGGFFYFLGRGNFSFDAAYRWWNESAHDKIFKNPKTDNTSNKSDSIR